MADLVTIVESGTFEEVRASVTDQCSDWRDPAGGTLLFAAARRQDDSAADIVRHIISTGVLVDAATNREPPTYSCTALFVAAKVGNLGAAKALVEAGASVNYLNARGETPLFWAARGSHDQVIRYLAENQAEPDVKDTRSQQTALFFAAAAGSASSVMALLENLAEPDVKDTNGQTALFYAAKTGDAACVKALIKDGASPHQVDNAKETPAFYAVKSNRTDALCELIEYFEGEGLRGQAGGRGLEHTNVNGCTVLFAAVEAGNLAAVKLLLSRGVNVRHFNDNRQTVLSFAVRVQPAETAVLLLEELLPHVRCYPEMLSPDIRGQTPVFFAMWTATVQALELLKEVGFSTDSVDVCQQSPLFFAAVAGRADLVRWLASQECLVDRRDAIGETALFYAVREHHTKACRALLDAKANPNIRSLKGQTPMELVLTDSARPQELLDVFKSLRKDLAANPELVASPPKRKLQVSNSTVSTPPCKRMRGDGQDSSTDSAASLKLKRTVSSPRAPAAKQESGMTPLMVAAQTGDTEEVARLLGSGARIEERCNRGKTAVFYATKAGCSDALAKLLESGARATELDYQGQSPLFCCEESDCVEQLLARRCNPDVVDKQGQTALFTANGGAIIALIRAGAPLQHRDARGRTALFEAAAWGDAVGMGALVKAGLDPNAADKRGQTALFAAAARSDAQSILRLIDEYGADYLHKDKGNRTAFDAAKNQLSPETRQLVLEVLSRKGRPCDTRKVVTAVKVYKLKCKGLPMSGPEYTAAVRQLFDSRPDVLKAIQGAISGKAASGRHDSLPPRQRRITVAAASGKRS